MTKEKASLSAKLAERERETLRLRQALQASKQELLAKTKLQKTMSKAPRSAPSAPTRTRAAPSATVAPASEGSQTSQSTRSHRSHSKDTTSGGTTENGGKAAAPAPAPSAPAPTAPAPTVPAPTAPAPTAPASPNTPVPSDSNELDDSVDLDKSQTVGCWEVVLDAPCLFRRAHHQELDESTDVPGELLTGSRSVVKQPAVTRAAVEQSVESPRY
jgi:hypothetical protein